MDTSVKTVLCVETGKIYKPLSKVKDDGFLVSGVSNVCNGRQKTYKGYHFRFI